MSFTCRYLMFLVTFASSTCNAYQQQQQQANLRGRRRGATKGTTTSSNDADALQEQTNGIRGETEEIQGEANRSWQKKADDLHRGRAQGDASPPEQELAQELGQRESEVQDIMGTFVVSIGQRFGGLRVEVSNVALEETAERYKRGVLGHARQVVLEREKERLERLRQRVYDHEGRAQANASPPKQELQPVPAKRDGSQEEVIAQELEIQDMGTILRSVGQQLGRLRVQVRRSKSSLSDDDEVLMKAVARYNERGLLGRAYQAVLEQDVKRLRETLMNKRPEYPLHDAYDSVSDSGEQDNLQQRGQGMFRSVLRRPGHCPKNVGNVNQVAPLH